MMGLKLNNHNLGTLSRDQIESLVSQESKKINQPLKLSYQDKIFEVSQSEIGVKVDSKQFTNQLLEEGRNGSPFKKLLEQNQALLGLKNEKVTGNISQTMLNLKIIQIQNDINHEPLPLRPDFTGDINKTLPAQDGIKVDTNKLTLLIADNIFDPPASTLPIPTMKTFTTHQEEELTKIRKDALEMTKQPISISSGGLTFTLSVTDLKSLLSVVERPDPKDPKKIILNLRLDDTKLNQKLGEFASKVESITHAEFDDHDARVAIYSQFYSKKRKNIAIPTGLLASNPNQKVLGVETNGEKLVYLTFDDGPNSIYHPMILDILKANNISATFFLVGQNTQRDSETAKRTAGESHKIGNHSLTHSFLPNLSVNSILKELTTTNDILKPFNGGQDIKFFRPPYGGVNLAVRKHANDLGLKLFLWDVDPRDWSEPSTNELVNRVVSNTVNGSDILLHSNHLVTVKALPKIIEQLKARGFTFKTLE